jgi:uncharacterized protein (DUF1330 family)
MDFEPLSIKKYGGKKRVLLRDPLKKENYMSVYYVNSYNIDDPETFAKYPPLATAIINKYGGKVLAADTEAISIEGKGKMMNAIVQFPSQEAALNCYNDPEYREVRKIRINATSEGTMILAKGLE